MNWRGSLHIGQTLEGQRVSIELDGYANQGLRIGAFASSGQGKGYLLGVILEELHARGYPIVMLDPEHELWTFKEFGALVVGGSEGHVPFNEDPAAIDAALNFALHSTDSAVVFDIGEAALADEARAAALGELVMRRLWALLDADRRPCVFAATEAAIFAPQTVPRGVAMPSMLRQFMQRGRKRGLITAVETQRIADIQKTVISQCNVAFVGGINRSIDFKAIAGEVAPLTFGYFRDLEVGRFQMIPQGIEVEVREREVTHGGGGPDKRIEIVERNTPSQEEVIQRLTAIAALDELGKAVAMTQAKTPPNDEPIVLSRVADPTQAAEIKRLQGRLASAMHELERERTRAASLERELAATAEIANRQRDQLESSEDFADALRAFLGDTPAPAPRLDEDVLRRLVREELGSAGGGAAPTLSPVAFLRGQFLEDAAQRLLARMRDLTDDERTVMLWLEAHPEGSTLNQMTIGITGNDSGGNRSKFTAAVASLVKSELVWQGGEGRMKRRSNIDAWVRKALGNHDATDAEIESVRGRALSLLLVEDREVS